MSSLVLLVLIMVLGVIAYVGLPLFRPDEDFEYAPVAGGLNDPYAASAKEIERKDVFSALNELEYDYHMNKVSEDDYHEMKEELMRRAALFLQDEEGDDEALLDVDFEDLDPSLCHEIEAEIEKEIAAVKKTDGDTFAFCPDCGASLLDDRQAFCHSCGHGLAREGVGR